VQRIIVDCSEQSSQTSSSTTLLLRQAPATGTSSTEVQLVLFQRRNRIFLSKQIGQQYFLAWLFSKANMPLSFFFDNGNTQLFVSFQKYPTFVESKVQIVIALH
jgi:hypothetical protein